MTASDTRRIVRVDPSRHLLMFDPHVFDKTRVDVIGCGAVGSKLAMEIAKLGVRNLHLWDDDRIEAHNIANQLYTIPDIGRKKVDALAEHILVATGLKASVHAERVQDQVVLGRVVFLAVDTMVARKEIFRSSLHLKFTTDLVVETRMGVEELRVYGFNPRDRANVAAWEATLSDDATTVESACRTRTTIGATAGLTACFAVHRFLQWYRREVVRDAKYTAALPLEQAVMLRPLTVFIN